MLVSTIYDYFHYIVDINKYKISLQMTLGRLTQNKCACIIETFEFGDFVNDLLIKSLHNEREKKTLEIICIDCKSKTFTTVVLFLVL